MSRKSAPKDHDASLERRAERAGVLTRHVDGLGVQRRPSAAVVRTLCDALESAAGSPASACAVPIVGARSFEFEHALRPTRPTDARLRLEDGGERVVRISPSRTPGRLRARLSEPLPLGVHRLDFDAARRSGSVFVLARPRSLSHIVARAGRRLAVFLPLYSITPGGPFGVASYTDLRDLCAWAARVAGGPVGTLPLFPAFLDRPFDPSPYAPVTRLMWNELFVDPREAPEWATPRTAPRASRLVDYRRCWTTARRTLRTMALAARSSPVRWADVLSRTSAETMRYAQFRAAVDLTGRSWGRWPAPWRAGRIDPSRIDPRDIDLYVYAQSLAAAQLASLRPAASSPSPLYLDLPVGVHAEGFDTWARPDLFLHGVSAGAPPDAINAVGQVWGFPPMHPTAGRADGYAHLRSILRRMLSVAGVLRIDHVMGLYRMLCIPQGCAGVDGAYMRYPEEELFAIVLIEAARAGATVVGEDLGSVPPVVRRLLKSKGLLGMHVQQFALGQESGRAIHAAGPHTLASLNTHDTPTFAGFWRTDDIALRQSIGQLDHAGAVRERARRTATRAAVARDLAGRRMPSKAPRDAAMSLMRLQARGPAPITLVNLEDLWGERQQQNVPGTSTECPNWRRRSAKSLRAITSDRAIAARLATLRADRRAPRSGSRS